MPRVTDPPAGGNATDPPDAPEPKPRSPAFKLTPG